MLDMKSQFAVWARSKPADKTYNWYNTHGCAMYQFLHDGGFPVHAVGRETWTDTAFNSHDIPTEMHEAADTKPYTFGALASRLVSRV